MTTNRSALPNEAVSDLGERTSGDALTPAEEGYDDAREFWNAMIDRESAVIVRCTGTDDVLAGVNFISESEGKELMAYRDHLARLVRLKNEWDPENLFRMNQNREPTVGATDN